MTDVLTPEQRHKNMSHIRGKDTSIEVILRKALFSLGYRYRKNVKELPGKPDLVFTKYRTVIFVNGCFWHRHLGCKYTTMPQTRIEFWQAKFDRTVERDQKNYQELERMGWKVYIVWECQIKHQLNDVIDDIVNSFKSMSGKDKNKGL